MFKVNRKSPLYGYLEFSFNAFARFHGKEPDSHYFNGLEKSDFCRIVRVSCVYVPLIIFAEVFLLAGVFGWMIVKPLVTNVNPVSAYLPLLIASISLAAVVGGVMGIFIFLSNRSAKKYEAREAERERLYKLYIQGKGEHPDLILGAKKDTGFHMFFKHVYMSFKERFCPIVKFEE